MPKPRCAGARPRGRKPRLLSILKPFGRHLNAGRQGWARLEGVDRRAFLRLLASAPVSVPFAYQAGAVAAGGLLHRLLLSWPTRALFRNPLFKGELGAWAGMRFVEPAGKLIKKLP